MPRGQIEDEAAWEEAKAHVMPYASHYRNPWAVTRFVYNRIAAAHARGEHVCPTCIRKLARSKKLPRYRR